MSMSRLALRLAAVEALNPYAALVAGPWPTLAGREVTDTPIDPVEDAEGVSDLLGRIEDGRSALVSVYTEEFTAEPYQPATFPPEQAIVTLVFELMIATRSVLRVVAADGSEATLGDVVAAVTDRQREATLDVLESQIVQALVRGPTGGLFRRTGMEVHRLHSVPQRGDDKTLRLAARTLKLTVKVKNERWPAFGAVPAPIGLDLLPEPLRTVGKALDPASSGGQLCLELAALIAQPAPRVPLAGITVAIDVGGEPLAAVFAQPAPPAT